MTIDKIFMTTGVMLVVRRASTVAMFSSVMVVMIMVMVYKKRQ